MEYYIFIRFKNKKKIFNLITLIYLKYICPKINSMKFIISSKEMQKKLQLLGGVLTNNPTMPILDYFLFQLDHETLKVTASDTQTSITASLTVESNDESEIAVPARILIDTLKQLPEQPITFHLNEEEENQQLEISTNYGHYSVAYEDADEFPRANILEEPQSISLPSNVLGEAISKTIFATGNDDLHEQMNGVFFEFKTDELRFVATDAHKLVRYKRTDLSSEEDFSFIMPKKPLNLIKSNLFEQEDNEVQIDYNKSNVKFLVNDIHMTCQLIEGQYPNYEAVIPNENPNMLVLDRTQFLSSLKRTSIFANKTTNQVRLKIAGAELNISTEDLDYSNQAKERLTCDYQGDDMEIGFNSKFLIEMLSNLTSKEVQLNMSLPNRAGILNPIDGLEEGEEITMLVMPVMLGS